MDTAPLANHRYEWSGGKETAMKAHRDDVVERLRAMGRNEEADRALEELPERFNLREYEGKMHSYGLDPEAFESGRIGLPGPIGSS